MDCALIDSYYDKCDLRHINTAKQKRGNNMGKKEEKTDRDASFDQAKIEYDITAMQARDASAA